ncbi:MAG: hypothetical protein R2738_08855 [Bacteroides graminisolvens]
MQAVCALCLSLHFSPLALAAQPLGHISYWYPVIIIGIAGAAHQAWSANIFSTVGDMFPNRLLLPLQALAVWQVVLVLLINKGSGLLFDHAETTNMKFMGFEGIESGYFIIFSISVR